MESAGKKASRVPTGVDCVCEDLEAGLLEPDREGGVLEDSLELYYETQNGEQRMEGAGQGRCTVRTSRYIA